MGLHNCERSNILRMGINLEKGRMKASKSAATGRRTQQENEPRHEKRDTYDIRIVLCSG